MKLPLKLEDRLEDRKNENSLRFLQNNTGLVDFASNDYLGLAASAEIYAEAGMILKDHDFVKNGATGSRLLAGEYPLYGITENKISKHHNAEAALIFNSGYDANLGFFSSVPRRGDLVIYDELVHASIRDGILMSSAKAWKFSHNDTAHLQRLLEKGAAGNSDAEIYVVTESVFSMDGDFAPLKELVRLTSHPSCHLVVDEAHATGVSGPGGAGLVQELGFETRVFARIHTFGKALGCHGAAILGSKRLKEYLLNFARSFVYSTALPPHSVATLHAVYDKLSHLSCREDLIRNIQTFREEIKQNQLENYFIASESAIQSCIVPGNEKARAIARKLRDKGFEAKPILAPTVPAGRERLRFCLHSFNSQTEIINILRLLATFIKN